MKRRTLAWLQTAVLGILITGIGSPVFSQMVSFTGVGVLPGDTSSAAHSVSRNGTVVTGQSVDATGPEAFIFITGSGTKTGIAFPAGWTTTSGEGIDADASGKVYVAGTGKNASGKEQAFFYDQTAGTFTAIPFLTGGDTSKAHAIQCHNTSDDVMVTGRSDMTAPAGHSLPFYHGYRWRKNSPAASLNLGDPPTDPNGNGNLAEAWCIGFRPDGNTVIRGFTNESGYPNGSNNPMAWTWYSGDSTISELWWADLSSPPTPRNSTARATSADGRYITGASTIEDSICESNRVAYLYDTDDKDVDATCNPQGGHYRALQYCVVADGAGGASCIWGSTMLGELAGHEGRSEGLGVSLDGKVVVGWARKLVAAAPCAWGEENTVAFIWDPDNGMRALKDVLQGHGLDLTGWELREARSVSSDGTVICGIGHHTDVGAGIDRDEGWVAIIAPARPGACCEQTGWGSGTCTVVEETACAGTWLGGGTTCDQCEFCPTPFADTDRDGDVDQADFAVFQACLSDLGAGVPGGCECFDQGTGTANGTIDQDDWAAFEAQATGPGVAWIGP